MASIPTYEKRVALQGGVLPVTRIDDPSGQGLAALGRGISDLGQGISAGMQADKAKLYDQDSLTAANAISSGTEKWNERSNQMKEGWTVGSEDLRKKSNEEFDTWQASQLAALKSEKAKSEFKQRSESMRSSINRDLYDYQDKETTAKVAADTKIGMDDDYQNLARPGGRDRMQEVVDGRLSAIKSQTRFTEAQRSQISVAFMKEAAESVERGEMRRDPSGWLKQRVAPQVARAEPGGTATTATPTAGDGGAVFDALLNQESGTSQFNKDGSVKTSPVGAVGIAQVMPATGPEAAKLAGLPWDEQKFKSDPEYNKALGRAYFQDQLKTFGGDVPKALAAYNMGPGSAEKGTGVAGLVAKYGENWLAHAPGETKNYVTSIIAKSGGNTGIGTGIGGSQPSLTAQLSNGGISFAADAPKTFNVLGDQKQYQMVDEAQRLVRQGNAVKRGEADRLLSDAAAMHKDGKTDPFNLTADYFTSSYGPVDGPVKYAAYAGGRAMAGDISNFATQSDAQITATLEASKPELGTGYDAADKRQAIRVVAAQHVVEQRTKDPMLFAQRNGLTASDPIDMAKPDGIGTELNKRIGTAKLMNEQYGAPYRVLTNGEASQMSAALRLMPTQQKLTYLDQIRTGLLQDSNAYQAVLGQIAPDSPVTAVAGSILVKDNPVTMSGGIFSSDVVLQPRNVAALILEGESILNPTKKDKQEDGRGGKFPMPKEIDLTTQFNGFVGEAFRADAAGYSAAFQAFKAYYAGAASRKGVLSDALDGKLAKEAATAVTGGVIDYNGLGAVMKPWGMADGEFKDRVADAFGASAALNGLKGTPMDNLSAYGLQSVGEGRYLLTNGQNYLNGPSGPIEINVTKPSMREKLHLTSSSWVPPPDTPRRQSGVIQ